MTAISVFGLGYVGCVSAACFAREGHDIIGVGISQAKVDLVKAGKPTIVEAGSAELVERALIRYRCASAHFGSGLQPGRHRLPPVLAQLGLAP